MTSAIEGSYDAEDDRHLTTLFVSDALQARCDTHRGEQPSRTNTSIVFDAIEALGERLPDVVANARVLTASRFPVNSGQTHDLGSGPVQLRIRPTDAQAAMLDKLTVELGAETRASWIPAVLNAYLPGRKEPSNMPWLAQPAD